jgi:uncharacterized protein
MLTLRPICENCGKNLPNDSSEAMICSFECTFCAECVQTVLHNVCPNCGGGLEKRPIRPQEKLIKYPAETQTLHQPIDEQSFALLRQRYQNIQPSKR